MKTRRARDPKAERNASALNTLAVGISMFLLCGCGLRDISSESSAGKSDPQPPDVVDLPTWIRDHSASVLGELDFGFLPLPDGHFRLTLKNGNHVLRNAVAESMVDFRKPPPSWLDGFPDKASRVQAIHLHHLVEDLCDRVRPAWVELDAEIDLLEDTARELFDSAVALDLDGRYTSAATLLHRASELQSAGAKNMLAYYYLEAKEGDRNIDRAIKLLHEAASRGNATAHFNLGTLYSDDVYGSRIDYGMAIRHFIQASDLGRNDAAAALAWLYATCPESSFTDGSKALDESVKFAVKNQGSPDVERLLAASNARLGNYKQAIIFQKIYLSYLRMELNTIDSANERARVKAIAAIEARIEIAGFHLEAMENGNPLTQ